jgi:uncharacterized protein YbjT (DUF2867 family)
MNVLLFGATGMVGQGVLRECLLDPEVQQVRAVGRTPTGIQNPKLQETIHRDLWHYSEIEADLSGFEHITYGATMAAAETLCRLNPNMKFLYVSGAGTDSTERGKSMWARVKGKTENALLRLPFAAAYMFRPGVIQPLHGARSKTPAYRVLYILAKPLLSLLHRAFPNHVLTTVEIGQAMLIVARQGYSKPILETADIRAVLSR